MGRDMGFVCLGTPLEAGYEMKSSIIEALPMVNGSTLRSALPALGGLSTREATQRGMADKGTNVKLPSFSVSSTDSSTTHLSTTIVVEYM